MKRTLIMAGALLCALAAPAQAQNTWPTPQSSTGGPSATGGVGMFLNSSGQAVPYTQNDPCQNTSSSKISVPINVTSATTTQLVAASAGTSIYVCGAALTIAPSATSADTAKFEYGTGASCGTGTTALTGSFGAGDLTTAAPPLFISLNSPGAVMATPASNALCLVSAGTTVNIQGVLSYVQQ